MASIAVPNSAGYTRPAILDWLTTVDHKKLGILYFYFTMFFFAVGGVLALLVRTQLAVADNAFVSNNLYNQIFTMHASAMLFLFIIPVWAAFGNYIVPLQIGAVDMAFPRINALSFWLLPPAGIIMFSGFFVDGGAAQAGWTAYSPLARTLGTGMDHVKWLSLAFDFKSSRNCVTVWASRASPLISISLTMFLSISWFLVSMRRMSTPLGGINAVIWLSCTIG